jgi:hypothetical protein
MAAIATAAVLAWDNSASRNLALATGALGGAAIGFLIQLSFELQSSQSRDHVSTEFTIDRSVLSIRQWNYTGTPGWRIGIETGASGWLVTNNVAAFDNDREMLTADFALFSLLSFLTVQEFDWQLRKTMYRSGGLGLSTIVQSVSKDNECTSFEEKDLSAALSKAGNMFAGAHLTLSSGRLRLPPKSTIEMARRAIVIQNPVCRISWNFEAIPTVLSHASPSTGGEVPLLESGQPKLETRMNGFSIEVVYFRYRRSCGDKPRQHPNRWTNNV